MADKYIVTNLSDVLGYLLEDVAGFVGGLFSGWMFMLTIITFGFMITLYFRFFKTIPGVLNK